MSFSITGKNCIVTGAASGIGLCYVKELFKAGAAKIAMLDCDISQTENITKIKNQYGANSCMVIQTDVTNIEQLKKSFQKVHDTFGKIDIVINNAGIMCDEKWEFEILLNCNAVVNGTLLALNYMDKQKGGQGGIIVNIASILGLQSMAGCPVYVGTKHFVVGFNRSLGMPYHYNKNGVKILTMCPGVTDTPLISEAYAKQWTKEVGKECARELNSLPEQKPEDVAKGMIHLIMNGESGSVWVCEGGKEIYEIEIPNRLILNRKNVKLI